MIGLKRLVVGLALFGGYVGVTSGGTGLVYEVVGAFLLGAAVASVTWGLLGFLRASGLPRRPWRRAVRPPSQPRPPVLHALRSRRHPSHTDGNVARTARPPAGTHGARDGPAVGPRVPQRVYEAAVLLGVHVTDPPEVIDQAYKRWVKTLHPDRNPSPGDATQQMQRINEARDLLLEYGLNRNSR